VCAIISHALAIVTEASRALLANVRSVKWLIFAEIGLSRTALCGHLVRCGLPIFIRLISSRCEPANICSATMSQCLSSQNVNALSEISATSSLRTNSTAQFLFSTSATSPDWQDVSVRIPQALLQQSDQATTGVAGVTIAWYPQEYPVLSTTGDALANRTRAVTSAFGLDLPGTYWFWGNAEP
jgi:hypothetical protein